MNTLSLSRPVWQRAVDLLSSAGRVLRTAWQQYHERRLAREAVAAALYLDEHTLKDMGAPAWLRDQVRERREQRGFDRELELVRDRIDRHNYY